MAVMKTFCGCLSTKTGTLAIILLYIIAYIALIISLSIFVSNDDLLTWYKDGVLTGDATKNCNEDANKDSWKCTFLNDTQYDLNGVAVGGIVLACIYFILAAVALYGTSKDQHWPLLPWIIMEFLRLLLKVILLVITIILWAVYLESDSDTSHLIAMGVIGAAVHAFFFYIWLCVVSHFQTLKELNQMGLLDKRNENVEPFVNDDSYSYAGTHTEHMDNDETGSIHKEKLDDVESPNDNDAVDDLDEELKLDDGDGGGERKQSAGEQNE